MSTHKREDVQNLKCREKDKDKENGRLGVEDQESDWEREKDQHHREKYLLNTNASPNKEEFTNKPNFELNLSNYEYCIASYHLLVKYVRN